MGAARKPAPDAGLSDQRTSLSWRRTALSAAVAGATVSHLLLPEQLVEGLISLALGFFVSLWLLLERAHRFHKLADFTPGLARPRGGLAQLALALVVACIALLELRAVLT